MCVCGGGGGGGGGGFRQDPNTTNIFILFSKALLSKML